MLSGINVLSLAGSKIACLKEKGPLSPLRKNRKGKVTVLPGKGLKFFSIPVEKNGRSGEI